MTTNWVNQTIWTGDNLPILRGMNSESVDLIYLDPPFNSKANYAAQITLKTCSCSAETAIASKATAAWSTCALSCSSERQRAGSPKFQGCCSTSDTRSGP